MPLPSRELKGQEYPRQWAAEQQDVLRELKDCGAEIVVLAGYMRVLSPEVIEEFRDRIINIHPSLIPKYCGKGFYGKRVHKAVLEAGKRRAARRCTTSTRESIRAR